jgi:hypothetical protein
MIDNKDGFFDNLDLLNSKELKKSSSISFLSKKQRLEAELARINEREQKLILARAKKQADLELLRDEKDDFKVKISLADYEILKQAKLQSQVNQDLIGGGFH